MTEFEKTLILDSSLIVLSVLVSKAGSRFGIPALILFLVIGMGAGAYGFGGLELTDPALAQKLGVFALIFILFSGGLDTKVGSIRAVIKPALILSTLGVLIATGLVGIFANQLFGFSLLEGFLLGATIASTDVAAVFTALRSKNVNLKQGLAPLLELESALNDPMAVFLGVALLGLATDPSRSIMGVIPLFFQQMIVGSLVGWSSGKIGVLLINRINLEFEGLYPVLTIGWVLLTYAATQAFGGSGFLAVYLTGIILGNENLLHKRSLIHFYEGFAWLGQLLMFLTMGLLVSPAQLLKIAPLGIALSAFLVLVARPVSVFISMIGSRFGVREKIVISWAGLRGAVPIILASYVLAAQIPKAAEIFHLVFFVTIFSILIEGSTIPFVARLLKIESPGSKKSRFPIEFNPSKNLRNKLVEVPIPTGSKAIGKSLVDLNLPNDLLVVLIERDGDVLVPRGATYIEDRDTLLVVCEHKSLEEVKELLL